MEIKVEDAVLGTALMLAELDNENWHKLNDTLKLEYIRKATEMMIKELKSHH